MASATSVPAINRLQRAEAEPKWRRWAEAACSRHHWFAWRTRARRCLTSTRRRILYAGERCRCREGQRQAGTTAVEEVRRRTATPAASTSAEALPNAARNRNDTVSARRPRGTSSRLLPSSLIDELCYSVEFSSDSSRLRAQDGGHHLLAEPSKNVSTKWRTADFRAARRGVAAWKRTEHHLLRGKCALSPRAPEAGCEPSSNGAFPEGLRAPRFAVARPAYRGCP